MNSPAEWQVELSRAFRSSEALSQFLGWQIPHLSDYPLLIPTALAHLIRAQGPEGILARQFLPSKSELLPTGLADPIGDMTYAKTSQLIHRYHNRALLIPTTVCPVNCRYCFRKNELQPQGPFAQDREATLAYLLAHREIEEVIFTGGDPLLLSDEKIDGWLAELAGIPHLHYIRFHSRVPVILPERLTKTLGRIFENYQSRFQIVMAVHSNHVSEWSVEAQKSCQDFRPQGMSWLAQSVLLKGINDDTAILAELFRFLSKLAIRPYYLHHPDQVRGGIHFWLSLEEGRRLWGPLHNILPGWMLPQYVIDVPAGHGKVAAYNPEGYHFSGNLLNRHGELVELPPSSELTEPLSHL